VIQLLDRAAAHQETLTLLGLALALNELGRQDEARALFDRIAAAGFDIRRNCLWLYGMAVASEVCAGLGDVQQASVLSDHLAPYCELVAHNTASIVAAVTHHLGLLATTLGHYDEAEAHFAMASATHARMRAPTLLARSRLEWARMLLRRGGPGDATRAHTVRGQALTTARELGLGNVERRAVELLNEVAQR